MSERILDNSIKHMYQGVTEGKLDARDILAGASTKLVNAKAAESKMIKDGVWADEGQTRLAVDDAMISLIDLVANLPDSNTGPSIIEILRKLHRN